jgi:hypothetical protein
MIKNFSILYRQHVIPRLKKTAHIQGLFLALGVTEFATAKSYVWGEALNLGAGNLPDDLLDEIDDWICEQILVAFDKAEPGVLKQRAIADRVAKDIRQWEVALCRMTRTA